MHASPLGFVPGVKSPNSNPVAAGRGDSAAVIDGASHKLPNVIPVGQSPRGIALKP
jgi:DNA-binding beta-propeller fold protein YncE